MYAEIFFLSSSCKSTSSFPTRYFLQSSIFYTIINHQLKSFDCAFSIIMPESSIIILHTLLLRIAVIMQLKLHNIDKCDHAFNTDKCDYAIKSIEVDLHFVCYRCGLAVSTSFLCCCGEVFGSSNLGI